MLASRVLVVEDEGIIAFHLRRQLIRLGYEVPDAVTNGDQALREVDASPPDVVLMDIVLEGQLDGIATAARIPTAHHIPVIYLTAHSDDATLKRASATNPYGYLLKPISERELHATIQMTLARCRSERASSAAREVRRHERKMAALGDLAGSVAGEFNDLLSVIYSQLELLGEHVIKYPAIAAPVDDAFAEAIEKEKLVQQLLAFSGRQTLTYDAVSMHNLVTDMAQEIERIQDRSIRIQSILPERLWKARTDARQLANALSNLITNARDAMPGGGVVTIEGQNVVLGQNSTYFGSDAAPGRYVLLTVTDTGDGMTKPVIERAFEPFFTTKPGGDGLGLSVVFGFIRQSGGHISIDSETGRGTNVRLWLPAAAEANAITGDTSADDQTTEAWRAITRLAGSRFPSIKRMRRQLEREASQAIPWGELPVAWQRSDSVLFASLQPGTGMPTYRLIVEQLPRRKAWDWAVWRPGDPAGTSRYGRASSVIVAMAAAEEAARQWARTDFTRN
ncbi:MAG: response regulator [Acetobacteraceae bacterium]|jgi:signal transduction histidine kinase